MRDEGRYRKRECRVEKERVQGRKRDELTVNNTVNV